MYIVLYKCIYWTALRQIKHLPSSRVIKNSTTSTADRGMAVSMRFVNATSPVVQLAVLVALTVIACTATSSSAAPAHLRRGRHPCSGEHIMSTVDVPPATANTDDNSVSPRRLRRAVRGVTDLLTALYDDVNQLGTHYAMEREAVLIGMHVDGMPRYNELNVATPQSQTIDLAAVVANMTSRLSRVAVFVNLVRLEEELHEPRPFKAELRRIEDHAEYGLYNILCHLHVIHRLVTSALNETTGDAGVELAASINAALSDVHLPDVSRPAYRHLRTITIISDMAQLLQHFIVVLGFAL